ncbi:virulence factor TspB C-terminal domain-related protein [Acinetobacter ursingii]|uniref:virulence factor TspB C-terminal domain-related protein n=1 Tax=Acinetobacter ursingii TaxID=108980 RepID=UPI00148F3B79|nr:virulence factor TspB C-terminal domain-related protein [Acinetobacter ursingii]
MRFFKYLIFVLFSFLSSNVLAAIQYTIFGSFASSSPEQTCQLYLASRSSEKPVFVKATQDNCYFSLTNSNGNLSTGFSAPIRYSNAPDLKCPDAGYPINVIQAANQPIEQIRCVPLAGTDKFCVAKKNNFPILNSASGENMISYVMENTSKTPVSNCTPLKEGQCNNKDPYGGCFKVPDDGCTRTQNGSIICPNNDTPNVQNNCTGTYCERPPTGCPSGYVSGSFNGKALCVKSSPSNGTGNGNGSGSGDGDGSGNGNGSGSGDGDGSGNGNGSGSGSGSNTSTSSSTSTSTSTSTSSNGSGGSTTVNVTNNNTNNTTVNVDVSGVISAINNMKSTLADFLNDVNKSVKEVTSTLNTTNQKIDTTNQKLDTTNNILRQINQNGKDTNNKLDQLINKQGGENNGNGTDLTATNQKIDELNKTAKESKGLLQDIKDWLTEPFTPPSDDSKLSSENLEIDQNVTENNYVSWGSSCPPDANVPINLMGQSSTLTLSWQPICQLLATIRWAIIAAAYFAAAYIILGMR